MREEEIGLLTWVGAIGEEGDGVGVWRPNEAGCGAGLAGRRSGDGLAMGEIVERGEAYLTCVKPCDPLAVGRDCNLSDGAGATLAGKDLIELSGSGLRGCGLGVSEERREDAEEDEGA